MKSYYVYILASKRNGTLFGFTNDVVRRVYEHKNDLIAGFTNKYRVYRLVYYEQVDDIRSAIEREAIEKMEQKMETSVDRKCQSILAGFI